MNRSKRRKDAAQAKSVRKHAETARKHEHDAKKEPRGILARLQHAFARMFRRAG
jgi:hypothetical protein